MTVLPFEALPIEAEPMDETTAIGIAAAMAKELSDLNLNFALYDDYYYGHQALPQSPKRLTAAYRELLEMSTSNWCRLVVDVVAERLRVGKITSSKNDDLDAEAWKLWQSNNLDAMQARVHTEALRLGVGYVSCWPHPVAGRAPVIRGESAMQVHVRYDEVTNEPIYAIKVWQGRDDHVYVTLYDHAYLYRLRTTHPGDTVERFTPRLTTATDLSSLQLRAREDDGGWLVPNAAGDIPFTAFFTQPDLLGGYSSEIDCVIPLQDRINRTNFHRLLTQEFHAFPQRWVTGIDVEVDADGNPKQPFETEVDRLWVAVSENTRFGQFGSSDPSGFLAAINSDIQALATQSRTPPHYLMGGMGQFPSGESVRATEYGLHRKVQDRQQTYGEAWEDVIRKAARLSGNTTLAEDDALAVGWKEVEARTEGEIADVLLKMSTLGVPRKVLWQKWGATPEEAERWEDELQKEMERAAAFNPEAGMALGQSAGGLTTNTDWNKVAADAEKAMKQSNG